MGRRAEIDVSLFGEPSLAVDGRDLDLSRLQGVLVGALVLAGPGGTRTDRLAEYLWPGEMPATALVSLRGHVKKVRTLLDDPDGKVLVRRPVGGYRLALDEIGVDVERFRSGCDHARASYADGRDGEAIETAAVALAEWTDEPFLGLDDSADAVAERASMAGLRRDSWVLVGEAGLRSGLLEQAIEVLERDAGGAPADDRLNLPLIRCLERVGRTTDALRRADQFQEALRDELGVWSEEVDVLARRLRSTALRQRSAPRAVPPPRSDRPFVGRKEELAALAERTHGSATAAPRITIVRGPAGIGKTRLLDELARDVGRDGVEVFVGRADRDEPPHAALSSLLRSRSATGRDEDQRLLGRLRALDGPPPDEDGGGPALRDHPGQRARLHSAFADHLLAAEPVLVVLDDAQWTDPDSSAALRRLADHARGRACHLVLGWRTGAEPSDAATQLLADLSASGDTEEVVLDPLSKTEAVELADLLDITGTDPVQLYRQTGGSPLLVHELARLSRRDLASAGVMVDLITGRFVADGPGRDLLEVAAVLGDEFALADLVTAAGPAVTDVAGAIDRCEAAGLLAVQGDLVAFTNALVPELIRTAMTATRRTQLHAEAFRRLSATGGSRLATHAREAHPLVESAEAIRAIHAAGRDARHRLAFTSAIDLFEQAVRLQEERGVLPPDEAARLHIDLGSSCAHLDEQRSQEVLLQAVPLVVQARSPLLAVELAEANVGRNLAAATALLDLLTAALQWGPGPAVTARIQARISLEEAESDATRHALDLGQGALATALEERDLVAVAHARRAVVSAGRHWMGRDEHRAHIAELISTARAIPDQDLEMVGLIHQVVHQLRCRQPDQARTTLEAFQLLAEEREWHRYAAYGAALEGVLALSRDDRRAFEEHSARATELATSCGFADAAVMIAGQQVCLAWHDEQMAALVEVLEALRDPTSDSNAIVTCALACALADADRSEEARATATETALDDLPKGMLHSGCLGLLASYAHRNDDAELAAGLVERLEPLAGTDVVVGAGAGHFGPVEGFIGRALLALGEGERAEAAFEAAARSAGALGQVLALRRIQQDRAAIGR